MEMGTGKTFVGSRKLYDFGNTVNLVVCQKSKINDWVEHFRKYFRCHVLNLTDKYQLTAFFEYQNLKHPLPVIGVINYDLVFRRPELKKLTDFTLLLDESSLIQNENTKRARFLLKLNPDNVILLSGTPCNGTYETLWSQLKLLGWDIPKNLYWNQYIDFHYEDFNGFPQKIVNGYKNVDRLKRKLKAHGAYFLTAAECLDLPEQVEQRITVPVSHEYRIFRKDRIVSVDGSELTGDTALTTLLRLRQLCGQYSEDKIEAFRDLVESTNDRIIVFYNFTEELERLSDALERPVSVVNGAVKDLTAYETKSDSITFIQYQAGAYGLNLQKANRIIYFTPPLSSELFEQSKKRIHRIGQKQTCFYYYLVCKNSVEGKIYERLKEKKDYTEALFKKDF